MSSLIWWSEDGRAIALPMRRQECVACHVRMTLGVCKRTEQRRPGVLQSRRKRCDSMGRLSLAISPSPLTLHHLSRSGRTDDHELARPASSRPFPMSSAAYLAARQGLGSALARFAGALGSAPPRRPVIACAVHRQPAVRSPFAPPGPGSWRGIGGKHPGSRRFGQSPTNAAYSVSLPTPLPRQIRIARLTGLPASPRPVPVRRPPACAVTLRNRLRRRRT